MKIRRGFGALLLACLLFFPSLGTAKVDTAEAYAINVLSGLFTGAVVGAGVGSIAYAQRGNQDPTGMIISAVYGAVGTAVGIGIPLSAYEVGMDRPGTGTTVLLDTLTFTMIGGLTGAAGGVLTYKDKVGTPNYTQAEDFLKTGGVGLCVGAVAGLAVGVYEAFIIPTYGGPHPNGPGIHARLGLLACSETMGLGPARRFLPNIELAELKF